VKESTIDFPTRGPLAEAAVTVLNMHRGWRARWTAGLWSRPDPAVDSGLTPFDDLSRGWLAFVRECADGYDMNIYEYENDLSIRGAVERALTDDHFAGTAGFREFRAKIDQADTEFRRLLREGVEIGDPGDPWWKRGVPGSAGPGLAGDFGNLFGVGVRVVNPEWPDLSPREQAGEWANTLSRTFVDCLAKEDVEYEVEIRPLTSAGIQQLVILTAADRPRVRVTVEPDFAILEIEAGETTGVLYEFEGRPSGLAERLGETEPTPRLLDEVALVHHVVACATLGYSYLRMPMYGRIRVAGYGRTAPLDWGTFEFAWPPVMRRGWRPGG
jgi:hypothetical protein